MEINRKIHSQFFGNQIFFEGQNIFDSLIICLLFLQYNFNDSDKIILMTKPFKYDNFVVSQIDTKETYSPYRSVSAMGASLTGPNQNQSLRISSKAQLGGRVRSTLKQKIDQLVGLCQEQNNGIKSKFRQVMGAEKEILDIMREELEQQQYTSLHHNYSRSNVEMFPSQNQQYPTPAFQNNGSDQRNRYNQNYPYSNRQTFQNAAPHLENFESFRNQPQQGRGHQGEKVTNPQSPHNYYQPTRNQNNQQGYHQGFPQGQNYFPHQPHQYSNYPTSPHDRANILRSKVYQVQQGSKNFPVKISHHENPYQDPEVQQLQNEVRRLRLIVNDYQNKLAYLNAENYQPRHLLNKIKQQGEDIRQDTLALLKNTASGKDFLSYNPNVKHRTSQQYLPSTNYGNRSQQDEFRAQLQQLRHQCQQLHLENHNIKKMKSQGIIRGN